MNIYLDMVGCKLNQAEIERYARQIRAAGHAIVASMEKADLAVINTCSVTGAAASDSRQKIRQAAGSGAQVVVTGCWSSMDQEAAVSLPGVRAIILNSEKDELVNLIFGTDGNTARAGGRELLVGSRKRTRAFIKVQDGCENHCTYCVTRLARGSSRSISSDQVVADINYAVAGGANEAVLTGVQIGSWGREQQPSASLPKLVGTILAETEIKRLRISSIEPWDVNDELIDLWHDRRLCRHFHLPLQSGSQAVLKRMARRTTRQEFSALVEKIRKAIPGVSITTDVIVGFPGESDAEFEESYAFIDSTGFSGGHVFLFSARPGTPAAGYPDQVPHDIRRQRSRTLRELFSKQAEIFREQFLGQKLDVLWERSVKMGNGWSSSGLSDNYIRVSATMPGYCWNNIDPVWIREMTTVGLSGALFDHDG